MSVWSPGPKNGILKRLQTCIFSRRRRHTSWNCDWSSDVCSSDLVHLAQPKKPLRRPKPFDVMRSSTDADSFGAPKPEGAKLVIAHGLEGGYFVPVSFVAKDWSVTPRRIRALLSGGRLLGRLQDNGYWEVRYPYSFTFGTRGPGLKRQQKQERRAA